LPENLPTVRKIKAVGKLTASVSGSSNGVSAQTQVRYYGKEGGKQLIWNTLKADKTAFVVTRYFMR
jgi:hypothetical protein